MPSVTEVNKAVVGRFFEAWIKVDLDTMRELMAPGFIDRSLRPGEGAPDRESYLRGVAEDDAALSIANFTIEDQVAEGDRVVTRYASRGSHDRGEYMGLAPTDKGLEVTGIVIHRLAGGKIVEEWAEGTATLEMTERLVEAEKIERERVEQELHVARRIQRSSLPEVVPALAGWEISPFYRPAREVGGDFYDLLELEGGRLAIIVGDATGKGVPAALVMSTTCGMLGAIARSFASPGMVLSRVNEALSVRIPASMFVTCFYGVLDLESGHLAYANAGHDLPYVWRGGGAADELRARGMPLGLMSGMGYEEKETTLQAGDGVLFYSDGLVEAHDPEGEMFGFPKLRALVAEHGGGRSLGKSLIEELYSFVGEDWEQEDDITLLELRRSAYRTPTS